MRPPSYEGGPHNKSNAALPVSNMLASIMHEMTRTFGHKMFFYSLEILQEIITRCFLSDVYLSVAYIQGRIQKFHLGGHEAPQAPRGVGCGKGVSPSPPAEGSGDSGVFRISQRGGALQPILPFPTLPSPPLPFL